MKTIQHIFILLCLVLCVLPFAGMAVRPTTESTENRTLSAFPSAVADGGINVSFFSQFETWFEEHFAFRNELVFADAKVQSTVFGVSAAERVIRGTDGWLYYTSTLRDYQGTDRLSDRELFAVARNLSLASDALAADGLRFVLAIPPNKNTLYGDHMPYYDAAIVDPVHEIDRLVPYLEDAGVPYVDLAAAFRAEPETLYLKRDSHWNNKGALLAYNAIFDGLGKSHDSYEEASAVRQKKEDGDLNRMLFSLYGEREVNYYYDIPQNYTVTNDADSVEDAWIETVCEDASGAERTLLMFRDSFGNTLLPLAANQYRKAYFTKEALYRLDAQLAATNATDVVFEKVERNLRDFLTMPPLMAAAPVTDAVQAPAASDEPAAAGGVTFSVSPYAYDRSYVEIRGEIPAAQADTETLLYVQINGACYPAYLTGETGFVFYLKADDAPAFPWDAAVFKSDENTTVLLDAFAIEAAEE